MTDLTETVARALATKHGLNWDEPCGMDGPDEGQKCRVLILFNENKHICRSSFAVEIDNDLVVLCTHEYHANHPGWHCHLTLASHDKATPGVMRTGHRRWPQAKARHSRNDYGITQASALSHVAARYRFQAQGGLI